MPLEQHQRWVGPEVSAALLDTPVVVINGARQVGKSTLVRQLDYPGSVEIVTFDDPAVRQSARDDPRGFVDRNVDTMVIDEAQLEPSIFRAIKAEVDRMRRPGRFVLTGSSRLLAAPDMAESLVGRVDVIELCPFTQGELIGVRDAFVDNIFKHPATLLQSSTETRAATIDRICRGGFPEATTRVHKRRARWFDSYVTTIVDNVIREIAQLERLAEIPRLLRLCAARTSAELNVAAIASELGIPVRTANAYVARLATAFLVETTPAWSNNLSAKVVRKPKLSIIDSGLAAHLTGATPDSLLRDANTLGPLLETFVNNELRRQITWSETLPTMHHFRDRSGAEVDVVLEAPNGDVVGIEIKATASPGSSDFKGLRFLAERLGERFRFGALMCLSPVALPMGEKMAILPVDTLWSPLK